MKIRSAGLFTSRALIGLGGAVALLALAASATFAAGGMPAFNGPANPSARPSQVVDKSHPSAPVAPTATETEKDADEPTGQPTDEPKESEGADQTHYVGACNALHGNAPQVIERLVQIRLGLEKGQKGHMPASSQAPVVPPGLLKVYNRLQVCQGKEPITLPTPTPGTGEPTPTPAEPTPTEAAPAPAQPTLPVKPGNGHGNGHGNGR